MNFKLCSGETFTVVDNNGNEISNSMKEITWSALKTLRDNSQLLPGVWYRITDYNTTTSQSDTQSAGHQFDVVVLALDENTLSEEARALKHSGDTYFSGSTLEAWKIWYCLDNDTTRFDWADSTNGKGVIYRMIDEFRNDCPYDFKNIRFKRYRLLASNIVYDTENANPTLVNFFQSALNPNNNYEYYLYGFAGREQFTGDEISIENPSRQYEEQGQYIILDDPDWNSDPYIWCEIDEGDYAWFFTFSNPADSSDSSLTGSVRANIFKGTALDNVFFGAGCSNTFGDECYHNTFGDSCESNTFGGYCYSNTFGYNCSNNTFGDGCYFNTFGYGCESNTFGNYCTSNTFGNSCYSNTFGVGCYFNTFGYSCYYNTFGNGYCSNTFGYSCYYNTFGVGCYSNTFGNGCDYNTFGDGVFNFIFGNTSGATTSADTKDFMHYIIVENGVQNVNAYCTGSTSNSNYCQNIRITSGVKGTSSSKRKQIDITSCIGSRVNTVFKPTNSIEISV